MNKKYLLLAKNSQDNKKEIENENLPVTFSGNGHRLRNYRIYGNTGGVGDLQANGKYLVPVTVSGKNLAPTILPQSSGGINIQQIGDGIYSMSGTSQKQNNFVFTLNLSLPMGDYKIVNMGTVRIALDFKNISGATVFKSPNPGEAVSFSYPGNAQREINIYVPILSNDTVDGTVKYMIIRASGEYNSYEPYHEPQTVNIYLDEQLNENDYIDFRKQKRYPSGDMISLPAIPTIDGTNILSVATETQPSKVYLQGNITVVAAPTQSLQASPQTIDLQPLSLDVVEKPDLQLEESEQEENIIETTGGDENAE